MKRLEGKRVAILTEHGFEEVELTEPKKALEEAGAKVDIVSPQSVTVKAWNHDHWSIEIPVDVTISEADFDNYDALVLPGGVLNPDKLRTNEKCVEFVQQFLRAGKPVAAICHGPQILIETKIISDRNMTSVKAIKTDLENAGARWVDKEVVTDRGLVTSRTPKDLPAFNKKLVEEVAEGIHTPSPAY